MPLALDILADILQHSTFEPEELERERTVILQEIGQANDTPDDIIFDHFQECAFPDQAMGRPVLGRPEIIRRLERDEGHRLSARPLRRAAAWCWRRPVISTMTGLSDWPKSCSRDLPAERPATHRAGALRGRRPARRTRSRTAPSGAGFPWPNASTTPTSMPASVLATAFGGGMSSRLFQEIREKRGLVYTIHCFAHSYRDGGLFGIYAGTGEEEAAELVPALCEEARKLDDGLSAVELARAKTQMKAGLLMSLESTSARCEQLAQHLLIHGTPFDPPEIVRRIEAVDDAAIRRVVARWRSAPPTLDRSRARSAASRISAACRRGSPPDAAIAMAPQRKSFPRLFPSRSDPFRLTGDRVFLRAPERGDWEAWASLRARSRDFLEPWEPSWPPDALSRLSFRSRVARYAEDWRTDQAYNFFIFIHDDTLVGGIGLSNVRRGVSETASLGYWVGEPFARQGLHDRGAAADPRFLVCPAAAASGRSRLSADQHSQPVVADPSRVSTRRAMPASICASKANGRTTCCSPCCTMIGGSLALSDRAG